MYRFEYYYENGKTTLSDLRVPLITDLKEELKPLMKKDDYDKFINKELTSIKILNKLMNFKKDDKIIKIKIINDETNEVIDYTNTTLMNLHYRFKIYFKDGTFDLSGMRGKDPEGLYNDFDGLMDWDEFYKLNKNNMTIKKTLKLAFEVYKNLYDKEYYRIEIINDETDEIIDYIERG